MIDQDLSAFYDVDDFASTFERIDGYTPPLPFLAIFAVVDQEALDTYSISGQFEIQYPTASIALADGDILRTTRADIAGQYKVRGTPMRINDGRESRVYLSKISETP